jgi:hypothetical protein
MHALYPSEQGMEQVRVHKISHSESTVKYRCYRNTPQDQSTPDAITYIITLLISDYHLYAELVNYLSGMKGKSEVVNTATVQHSNSK